MTSMETDVASSSRVVIPGESLFPSAEDLRPGKGTYELHGHIYSSLLGYVYVREDTTDSRNIRVIEVRRNEERHQHVSPHIGAIVTAKVINIGPRYAKCQLLSVEDTILGGDYTALLRKEDIRSTERDKIEISECVLPGDILLARVISFGDTVTSFLISTAEEQLGVVMATGETGEKMMTKDWNTVQGVETGRVETRKIAKVPNLNLHSTTKAK
ncbi:hypothetical protein WR25_15462 [Diploscapter pachys]|uniref:S1 motif domain-containing protein n=1 Tax=Diploscapter pachys TaxID=2018661 RepID=A0A2A2KXH0_9BILA|nr:hypothetical protein WR25_15462 [Diploscapter pachys]